MLYKQHEVELAALVLVVRTYVLNLNSTELHRALLASSPFIIHLHHQPFAARRIRNTMSLSFVSSAVLSSTDGVSHNEEKSIESKEVKALRNKQEHKPLFEQLRNNREEEDAAREEFQRTMMRGTRALNEEDCAHLDAIQREKEMREQKVRSQEDEEIALFRAAKADRAQADVVLDNDDDDNGDEKQKESEGEKKVADSQPKNGPLVPKILAKRRRQPTDDTNVAKDPSKKARADEAITSEKLVISIVPSKKEEGDKCGLESLLGAYGSSDDDSD
jgi:hypothetical protein